MPEQRSTAFETTTSGADTFTVPAAVLARWAAKASQLAAAASVPSQPTAA